MGSTCITCVVSSNINKTFRSLFKKRFSVDADSECGPVNLTYLGIRDVPHDFEIIVPDVSAAAERTYIFCIIGLILFGVWFITSFFSLSMLLFGMELSGLNFTYFNCYSFDMHIVHWAMLYCNWDIPVRHHVVLGVDLHCSCLRILLNRFHTKFRKYIAGFL